jgi:type I restriction enzyme S subunit
MSKFQEVLIGDVCAVGDGAHSKVNRVDDGVRYLTSKNIGQGNLKLDNLDYISEESFEKLFPKHSKAIRRPQSGDVLFGIIGTFGNAYLYKEGDYFGFSSSIGILRPNQEKLCSEYLYYVVSSEVFKKNHANHNAGSVQGYTNIPTVKSLRIPLPTLTQQKRIAKILKSLDDKIKLNRQTNQTLEQIAQAIFKSWFVDFEPVKAKVAALSSLSLRERVGVRGQELVEHAAICALSGKTPEQLAQLDSQTLQQLKTTAALFPDALVDSELEEIPEGWEVGTIGTIADVIDCLHSKKPDEVLENTGRIYLQLNNISDDGLLKLDNKFFISESDYVKWTSRIEVKQGDCIITNVGRVGAVSIIPEGVNAAIGRNITAIRLKVGYPYPTFLITLMTSEFMRREIGNHTDVGTILDALNVKNIPKLGFNHGGNSLLTAFESFTSSNLRQRQKNIAENMILSDLRDFLLPKLLSGELSIESSQSCSEQVL